MYFTGHRFGLLIIFSPKSFKLPHPKDRRKSLMLSDIPYLIVTQMKNKEFELDSTNTFLNNTLNHWFESIGMKTGWKWYVKGDI